jgi:glycosyltransferase involved in cell wall biosynthesis
MAHARIWLEQGHEVTVVTCQPNFPTGKVFPGYRNRLYAEEWVEGVRVVRVWSYMAANEGLVKRTVDYVSYMLSAVALCPRFPDFDVALATSPPFFDAIAGHLVAKIRRRPWVFEIRDLWPASIRAVGVSKSPALRLVEALELFLYRKADRIVSLTHSFERDLVGRGVPRDKIDIAMNGVDAERFARENVTYDARERLGVSPDTFLAGYIGTTGLAHGLMTLIDAAELCRDRSNLRFLIMGQGAEREALEEEARRRGLTNILFRDFVPHEEVANYMAALDVSIVHLRPDPLFKTVIPSKIFENMAMELPMIMAVEGESAKIVADAGAGLCIPSGDAPAMADAVTALSADRERRRKMGLDGRRAAEEKFSRRAGAGLVLRSLQRAIDDYRSRRMPARRRGATTDQAAHRSSEQEVP